MIYAAIIAASLALVALVAFAVRFGGMAGDLSASEADRKRLEDELRAVVEDDAVDDAAAKARVADLLEERDRLYAEIARRRQPGDARRRLRMLSEAGGGEASHDNQD